MTRVHNFNAGPGVLPEEVLREAQEALWNLNGSGMGVLECSHRSALFEKIVLSARDRVAALLGLSDDQVVLFLQGGAQQQFFQLPMNVLRGGRASYLDTGVWAAKAVEEARRFGTIDVLFSSKPERYDRVPRAGEWGDLPEGTKYLHYTSNNTVAGTEYHYVPETGGKAWLVCDMSSDILSRPIDGSKFDFIYAGAQKNMGPPGVVCVAIRRSLLERCDPNLPTLCRYQPQVDEGSLFNTPNTFGIWMIERMCAWVERQGGLEEMDRRNHRKAGALYAQLDKTGFYRGLAKSDSRSRMNVTFTTGQDALDTELHKTAEKDGFVGLKGHRLVGGLRASLYNACPETAVAALVAFLAEFERKKG